MSLLETQTAKMLRIWREKWSKLIEKRENIFDLEPKISKLAPKGVQMLPKMCQKCEIWRCQLGARRKMHQTKREK